MLTICNCARCGKQISTIMQPIFSGDAVIHKWQGVCKNCMSDEEFAQMMYDINLHISRNNLLKKV